MKSKGYQVTLIQSRDEHGHSTTRVERKAGVLGHVHTTVPYALLNDIQSQESILA